MLIIKCQILKIPKFPHSLDKSLIHEKHYKREKNLFNYKSSSILQIYKRPLTVKAIQKYQNFQRQLHHRFSKYTISKGRWKLLFLSIKSFPKFLTVNYHQESSILPEYTISHHPLTNIPTNSLLEWPAIYHRSDKSNDSAMDRGGQDNSPRSRIAPPI